MRFLVIGSTTTNHYVHIRSADFELLSERTVQSARNQCLTNALGHTTAKWVVPAGKNSHVRRPIHAQNANIPILGAQKRKGSGGEPSVRRTGRRGSYTRSRYMT